MYKLCNWSKALVITYVAAAAGYSSASEHRRATAPRVRWLLRSLVIPVSSGITLRRSQVQLGENSSWQDTYDDGTMHRSYTDRGRVSSLLRLWKSSTSQGLSSYQLQKNELVQAIPCKTTYYIYYETWSTHNVYNTTDIDNSKWKTKWTISLYKY